ncbi:InlB B-repeat-containing protein [Paludibaculum fermentans]|uniref:InlB B-repeat-containing protein n=1 Tax=Paludibaculum fermentans TaxID=1473598 RepID=UPI003EC1300E
MLPAICSYTCRPSPAAPALWLAALILAGWMPTAAGQSPMNCTLGAGTPVTVRSDELAAKTADMVLVCTGGTPTTATQPVPTANFQVFLNTNITSRTIGTLAEALLLIDEPAPASQAVCITAQSTCGWTGGGAHTPNVFQGTVVGSNSIAFMSVPVDPPTLGGQRVFRISNLRANPAQMGVPGPIPTEIQAYLSISGTSSITLSNSITTVAYIQNSLNPAVRNSSNDAQVNATTGVEFQKCAAAVQQRFSTLRFQELLPSAFLPRSSAPFVNADTSPSPLPQSVPGLPYASETGFYNPLFPATNGLNIVGLADSGTRLQASFTNMPAGVTLYASTVPVTFLHGIPTANSGSQLRARMISAAQGPFAATTPTTTLEGIPAAAIPFSGGAASVVWEVLQADVSTISSSDFLLWISYPANTVGLGTASVSLHFAPVSTISTASSSAPLPRFQANPTAVPLLTVGTSCAGSPYTVDTQPAGLQFTADGTTYTAPKSFNWTPGSSHTIAVASPQSAGATRYVFTSWSDGGSASHSVTVPATAQTYTASFKTQHQLTRTSVPAGGGLLTAMPASADGFYDAGTSVTLTALPSTGFSFVNFTGSLTGTANPGSVTMSAPRSVVANFSVNTTTVGVTPSNGKGTQQLFQAQYSHSKGYQRIRWVQLLLATDPNGGGQPFCFLHYDVQGNGLWLYSDQAGFFQGPIHPGVASNTLQSSNCALNTAASSAAGSGSILEVDFTVFFKAAGARNIYMRALDIDEFDTGWSQLGTWTQMASAQPVLSVSPAAGSGAAPTFTLNFADPPGFTGYPFGWVEFLVAADPTGGGQPFCFVHYDRAGNGLWMYSSDVGYFVGPVAPGVISSALSSSACAVKTGLVTRQNFKGDFILTVPLTLKAPMTGQRNTYLRMFDALSRDTDWQLKGTWTKP